MSVTKDKFIEETGGFKFGESDSEFQMRVGRGTELKAKLLSGKNTPDELEAIQRELCRLNGEDFDAYEPND